MSHPVGAGAGGPNGKPVGAHPIDDEHHRRGAAWWQWLLALILLLVAVLLIVLLVRHLRGDDDTTAAKKTVPTGTAPPPAGTTPATSTPVVSSAAEPAPSAAPGPAVADAACSKPTLTVSPTTARAGQTVTVVGQHFSGCHAATGKAVPTVNLPVSIGVTGADSVSHALAKARTSANGSFTVRLALPARTAGSTSLTLAAASTDVKTTLAYAGTGTIAYRTTAKSPRPGGGMPTGVPAGTGGQAASTSTSTSTSDTQLSLLAGGLLLAAGGTIMLGTRRRRTR